MVEFFLKDTNLSMTAQHIIIFKSPKDMCQIRLFALYVAPVKSDSFLGEFEDLTQRTYLYLDCDISQNTPEYCDEVEEPIVRIQVGNATKLVYIQYIHNSTTLLRTTLAY